MLPSKATEASSLNDRIRDPFYDYCHFRPAIWEPDHAALEVELFPECKNDFNAMHGGFMLTLADHTTGTAAHTDGRSYVTSGINMHFLSNSTDGIVTCDAHVVKRGRSIAVVEFKITDDTGRLLATGSSSFFCVSEKEDDRSFRK